jgi:hypothetical protein
MYLREHSCAFGHPGKDTKVGRIGLKCLCTRTAALIIFFATTTCLRAGFVTHNPSSSIEWGLDVAQKLKRLVQSVKLSGTI